VYKCPFDGSLDMELLKTVTFFDPHNILGFFVLCIYAAVCRHHCDWFVSL